MSPTTASVSYVDVSYVDVSYVDALSPTTASVSYVDVRIGIDEAVDVHGRHEALRHPRAAYPGALGHAAGIAETIRRQLEDLVQ